MDPSPVALGKTLVPQEGAGTDTGTVTSSELRSMGPPIGDFWWQQLFSISLLLIFCLNRVGESRGLVWKERFLFSWGQREKL